MSGPRRPTPNGTESHLSLAPGPAPATTPLRLSVTLADGTRLELEVDAADWGVSRLGSPVGAAAIFIVSKGGKRSRGKLERLLGLAAAPTGDDPVSA